MNGRLVAGSVPLGVQPISDVEIRNANPSFTWEPSGRWLFVSVGRGNATVAYDSATKQSWYVRLRNQAIDSITAIGAHG